MSYSIDLEKIKAARLNWNAAFWDGYHAAEYEDFNPRKSQAWQEGYRYGLRDKTDQERK